MISYLISVPIEILQVDDSSPVKSQDCACGIDWNDLKRTQAALATAFDVFGKAPYTKQVSVVQNVPRSSHGTLAHL
jgi:hypothetical protein